MSTTFGVSINTLYIDSNLLDKHINHNLILKDRKDYPLCKIAFRYATKEGARIEFINPIAALLPNSTIVIALDNEQQGIETIGDIKRHIARNAIKNQFSNVKFFSVKTKR